MWVGWRRLSAESAGVGEKQLWLIGLPLIFFLFLLGRPSLKSLRLRHFTLYLDEIWRDCSVSKDTSINGICFLILRHNFKTCICIITGIQWTANCQRVNFQRRSTSRLQWRTASGTSQILNRRLSVPEALIYPYLLLFFCLIARPRGRSWLLYVMNLSFVQFVDDLDSSRAFRCRFWVSAFARGVFCDDGDTFSIFLRQRRDWLKFDDVM